MHLCIELTTLTMIRKATQEDFDFIYALHMHPQVNRFLLYEIMSAADFKPNTRRTAQKYEKVRYRTIKYSWSPQFQNLPEFPDRLGILIIDSTRLIRRPFRNAQAFPARHQICLSFVAKSND